MARYKPVEVPTPLRTIKMEYNSDADLSELEITALHKYIDLHKDLLIVQRKWESLRKAQQEARKPQQELREQLTILQAEIRQYRQLAGFTKEEVAQMPEPNEEETFDPGILSENGRALQAIFETHYDLIQDITQRFKDLEADTDQLEEQYEDFDNNYFSPIIQNYQQMEIDICRLDEDFNDFNGLMDDLTTLIRTILDERNVLVSEYNTLVQDIDASFNRIDRVLEEINTLTDGKLFEGKGEMN